jgi:hypothetical protein
VGGRRRRAAGRVDLLGDAPIRAREAAAACWTLLHGGGRLVQGNGLALKFAMILDENCLKLFGNNKIFLFYLK